MLHALIINVALGLGFSALGLLLGPSLYRALGGEGDSLAAALRYSNVVFACTALVWLMNALASVIRGTGNVFVPALAICAGVVLVLPLSPRLIFGLGPFPALGIAGGGVAVVFTTALTAVVLGWYIPSGRCLVRLRLVRPRWPLFPTSCVSAPSPLSPRCRPPLTVALTTALVGAAAAPTRSPATAPATARIPAGAAGVRPRRAAGRAGRHQHRRGPERASAAHRLIGGGVAFVLTEAVGLAAAIWPRRGSGCSATTRECWRPAPLTCGSSGRLMGFSAWACRCISPRKVRGGCSGLSTGGTALLSTDEVVFVSGPQLIRRKSLCRLTQDTQGCKSHECLWPERVAHLA